MKYDRCQEYFDIYIENPDVCSLILKDPVESSIHGRALLWILDETKYMDRVQTEMDLMAYLREVVTKMDISRNMLMIQLRNR
jgi:hypothetical protein